MTPKPHSYTFGKDFHRFSYILSNCEGRKEGRGEGEKGERKWGGRKKKGEREDARKREEKI